MTRDQISWGAVMIAIFHTTSVIPHQFTAYLEAYGRDGWPVARETLEDCGGAYVPEIGPLQQLVQIWFFRDQDEWAERRARLSGNPRWQAFRASATALILEESERALRPAPFMPIKNLTEANDFVEMRIYQSHPGVLDRFLEIYEAEGLPIQIAHLGNCIGYFRSLDGRVDEVVSLWGYSDLNDRITRRAALFADPGFKDFLAKGVPHFRRQENMILRPAAFWRER
jgi:hypothetical protein